MVGPVVGYTSSAHKDLVRQQFDLPLVRRIHRLKEGPIAYLGLPGSEARDIELWGDRCSYVAAVERHASTLREIERRMGSEFPQIQYRAHLGEVDTIILKNKSNNESPSGKRYDVPVPRKYRRDLGHWVWDFDVLFLDYFGKLIPRGDMSLSGRRATALTELFRRERQDAWQRWALILTIEAGFHRTEHTRAVRDYLTACRDGGFSDCADVIDFHLASGVGTSDEDVRLVRGLVDCLLAIGSDAANVELQPRGTVSYVGSGDKMMLHLAYEAIPRQGDLPVRSAARALLTAPFLTVEGSPPRLVLAAAQPPGLDRLALGATVAFLHPRTRRRLAEAFPS